MVYDVRRTMIESRVLIDKKTRKQKINYVFPLGLIALIDCVRINSNVTSTNSLDYILLK